jgi:putative glutamine amidotransferase
MLRLCGLRAVYVTSRTGMPSVPVQGIVIGGGDDIEPEHYGGEPVPRRRYDLERDRFEIAMIQQALAANIPTLGICRGAQLINVVAGGSLYQDIRPLRRITPNRRSITPVKWVDLDPGSRLIAALNHAAFRVNSLHEQAIERVGEGLSVIGRDRDGFVQAIEGQYGFLLGVQWHPEYLPYRQEQRKLFRLFADAVLINVRQLQLQDPHIQ